jgi:head-tail adaptor
MPEWPRTIIAHRRHRIHLQDLGEAVRDGQGSWTYPNVVDLSPPEVWSSITPATAADLERIAGGTVIAEATHVLRFPYHPGVTTQTQILFGSRTFNVAGVANPNERNLETIVLATEAV